MVAALALPDRLATLAAFTAESVAAGLGLAGTRVTTLVVAGGGARNATLLAFLAARTGAPVTTAAIHGLDGDFLEAQAFAYLAVRRCRAMPSTFPTTTGSPHPVVCGDLAGIA